jgi:uncharacterized membrane protein YobD (UPF0266 family)
MTQEGRIEGVVFEGLIAIIVLNHAVISRLQRNLSTVYFAKLVVG